MESAGRTLVCSVLFLDIADYSQKSVAEQLQLKQAFNQALGAALEHVASRDRIILDTGDGAAITFMGDPEDALFASMAMRDLVGGVPVRLGVNLGPVRLVKDLNGQMNIIGDGINVAQRVMSFARPGQLLVSRSFYEVVSCLSRDYQNLFRHEGSRTDKHVRAHDVYSVTRGLRVGVRRRAEDRLAIPRAHTAYADDQSAGESEEDDALEPAQVFDAGPNLVVSGYSKAGVEEALNQLAQSGSRLISPLAKVGNRWVAACEHPGMGVSACKVEKLGTTHIVTGSTREAVAAKVEELVQFGSVLVGDVECADGVWTAVCDAGRVRS
ncbi:MAG: adenylate/guanylate cyclase domain-containing protein [Burkholderiales bacterium]